MPNTNQITHESETQRQFIRLQLPAMVQIDDNRFTIKDLSSGGMAIRDIGKEFKKGQNLDITLILPFADFSLDIELKAEILYIDQKTKIAGCRFIDLKQNQISILNHVVRSFIAGDLMNGDDIINVVSRENFVNVRNHNQNDTATKSENIKKYSIYALIALAILLVSSFIIGNIMDKLLIIKTSTAQVYVPSITLNTPASGIYYPAITSGIKTIAKGQVIARIKNGETNKVTQVISPCDCYIAEQFMLSTQYVSQGAPLYMLIDQHTKTTIKASLPMGKIHSLNIGMDAVIDISGIKEPIKGKVTNIITGDKNLTSVNIAEEGIVYITPQQTISIDLYNRPAFVEFYL